MKDIDVIEVNEAFASQYLAVEKELGLDPAKTNVNGGAIALGHRMLNYQLIKINQFKFDFFCKFSNWNVRSTNCG